MVVSNAFSFLFVNFQKFDYDSSTVRKRFFREALLQIFIPYMLKQLSPSCAPVSLTAFCEQKPERLMYFLCLFCVLVQCQTVPSVFVMYVIMNKTCSNTVTDGRSVSALICICLSLSLHEDV